MSGQNINDIFDPAILDSLVEVLGSKVSGIVTVYIEEFTKSIQVMREALASGDYETIGRTAHSLKSSSGNVGAKQLSLLAEVIEQKINSRASENELTMIINKLEQGFNTALPMLTVYSN